MSQTGKPVKWAFGALILGAVCCQAQAPAEWKRPLQPSLAGGNLVCLSNHPIDMSKFLVANRSQLFEGADESDWKMIWSNTSRDTSIEKILSFPWLPEYVFLITTRKVFMGRIGTKTWSSIYESGSQAEKRPLSFTVMPQDPNHWAVGTVKGLWTSQNAGKTWARSDLFSGSHTAALLLAQEQKLFIGSENSLYISLSGSSAREVFTLPKKEGLLPAVEHDERPEDMEPPDYEKRLHALIADPTDPGHLYLGTYAGVFESIDGGYQWRPLSRSGMQGAEVLGLAYHPEALGLFAATPHGIYQYQESNKTWKALHEGIAQPYSKSIAILNGERIIAVTGDGFLEYQIKPEVHFTAEEFTPSLGTLLLFRKLIHLEPSPRETHRVVIQYADVSNGKIKRWHIASRAAGLLPTFSFGKDFSASNNIDLDRGSTNTPDAYIEGPYDKNKGWDADVSWRLGDIIYSSDQTSIDSRGKLMVELRQDLLTEATRIYFERRRLQTDIVYTPSLSEQEHLERLIRMDELTALLDGMTDGFFSKRLERIYEKHPRLNNLWAFYPEGVRGTEYGDKQ